ncbi:MAG: family 2 glycosyl transferase [Terriglobia bacterium]|nr:MAG: family 2 glycosyl transferase [Terriglobia bacterium]
MAQCVIVVPCYNEASRLNTAEFRNYLARAPHVSMLFVNDGSSDDTLAVLQRMQAALPEQVEVLDMAKNSGKGEAVRLGLLQALERKDAVYAGFWDADLATPLSAIDDLLNVCLAEPNVEMVLASRVKLLGREIERLAVRHYLGRVFATCASLVLSIPVYDTQCGAKLFRVTPKLPEMLQKPFCSRWIFDVELIARFLQLHGPDRQKARGLIYEFPLFRWTDVPGSKVRPRDFFIAMAELWTIWRTYPPPKPTAKADSAMAAETPKP